MRMRSAQYTKSGPEPDFLLRQAHYPDGLVAGDKKRVAWRVDEDAGRRVERVRRAVRHEVDREPDHGDFLVLHARTRGRGEIESAHAANARADLQNEGTRAVGRDGVSGGARGEIARGDAAELGEIRVVDSVERAAVEAGDEHAVAVAVEGRQVDVFLPPLNGV